MNYLKYLSLITLGLFFITNTVQSEMYSIREAEQLEQSSGLSLTGRLEVQYTNDHYIMHLTNKDNVYIAVSNLSSSTPQTADISLVNPNNNQYILSNNTSILEITNSYFHSINGTAHLRVTNKSPSELLLSFINL